MAVPWFGFRLPSGASDAATRRLLPGGACEGRCLQVEDKRDAIVAGAVAAILSGVPSMVHAVLAGDDPLEPSQAAGTLLLPREGRRGLLLAAAAPAHLRLSLGGRLF
jgi:hypothetical protein